MRKHTPGPWVSRNNRAFRGGKCICSNVNAASPTPQNIEEDVAMSIANARLMAAAPEMLGALQHIEEYWNRDSNEQAMTDALWHIIETAQAAIAKATA
ncbi:hypothetical protein AAA616_27255 [Pseudomonas aeruginosa]